MGASLVIELAGDLLELHGFWVKLRRLDELEEEIRKAFPKTYEGFLWAPPVQHVSFPVDQVDHLTRQVAVELLDRPLHMQQHVQALIDRQQREPEAAVEVHKLLGSCGEGRVDSGGFAITLRPDFRLRHRLELTLDLRISVRGVCLDLQLVNCLQKLRLLAQELMLCSSTSSLVETRGLDSRGFVHAPSLQLLVEHAEVLEGSWMHSALNLSLVPQVGF